MKELVTFLYTYYGVYFYFFTALVSYYLATRLFKELYSSYYIIPAVFINFGAALVLSHIENNLIIKFLSAFIIGFLSFNFCCFGVWITKTVAQSELFNKYKYGLGFIVFFVIYTLLHIPDEINIWTASWYVADYSLGIGSRFFVGALLHLFSPDFISARLAFWFCMISYLILRLLQILLPH